MVNDKDLMNLILSPFNWDKNSYWFNRDEKDMNPYSIKTTKENITIVHNVLGINKDDLNVSIKTENRVPYIVIEGKTKDAITEKEYSINSRFSIDEAQMDLSKTYLAMNNGLLYITIPFKKSKVAQDKKLEIH